MPAVHSAESGRRDQAEEVSSEERVWAARPHYRATVVVSVSALFPDTGSATSEVTEAAFVIVPARIG